MGRRRQHTSTPSLAPPGLSDARGPITRSGVGAVSPGDVDVAQDRRFITALARGLEVLRCFRPQDHWLAHQELARRTRLPQATVSRLTFTLTALGYLKHRAATGEYALTPAVLALGFSVLSNFELGRIARPFMADLVEHSQAAVSLGVRHGSSMVYVAHCRGTARIILGVDVGARIPLADTAMGRAWWCTAAPGMRTSVARLLEAEEPARWPQRLARLEQAQAEYALKGFVSAESEWESEVSAVGVGLNLGDGREPLSMTLGGPSVRLRGDLLHQDFGPALVRTGRAVVAMVQAGAWRD